MSAEGGVLREPPPRLIERPDSCDSILTLRRFEPMRQSENEVFLVG